MWERSSDQGRYPVEVASGQAYNYSAILAYSREEFGLEDSCLNGASSAILGYTSENLSSLIYS